MLDKEDFEFADTSTKYKIEALEKKICELSRELVEANTEKKRIEDLIKVKRFNKNLVEIMPHVDLLDDNELGYVRHTVEQYNRNLDHYTKKAVERSNFAENRKKEDK